MQAKNFLEGESPTLRPCTVKRAQIGYALKRRPC